MHKLTVIAWLASDTGIVTGDLRDAMRRDLDELREGARLVGPDVAVWAAYDDGECWYAVNCRSGTVFNEGRNPNMADPANLLAFCDRVMAVAPAEHYALIVGGHGTGIKRQDVYTRARNVDTSREHVDGMDTSWQNGDACAQGARVDLAFDDGSRDAMSVSDLGLVCQHIASKGPLDIVLLDSCLMATIEVCEALMGSARVLVASPEAVPAEGFPYAALLNRWGKTIEIGEPVANIPEELGRNAVDEFAEAYDSTGLAAQPASILAVDLAAMPDALARLDDAAERLMGKSRDGLRAWADSPRTTDPDYLYVQHLLSNAVSPIISEWSGGGYPDYGLTAYVPQRGPLPEWYAGLPIASRVWGRFVKWLVGE